MEKKFKTGAEIQHIATSNTYLQILKRLTSKSIIKSISWSKEVQDNFKAHMWSSWMKNSNQNRNDSNKSGKIHAHSRHLTWSTYKKSEESEII
jgi:hypothetical protein